ncbi:MAG: S8 family peptidase, partial [Chitinophagales bacterium]|nr:S8 family peptidase [Chitinophagales bacterium]
IAGGDALLNNPGGSLIAMKMLDSPFFGRWIQSIYEGAIDTSFDNGFGLHVMNMSFGVDSNWQFPFGNFNVDTINIMRDAIRFAFQNKVVMVGARGNISGDVVEYPTCYKDDLILSVGGSGINGDYGGLSYGHSMDFIAPSWPDGHVITILSDLSNKSYGDFTLSSAAAPHVTGLAALLLSYLDSTGSVATNLAPEDVEHIIENTCTDELHTQLGSLVVGYDDKTGWGRINAGKALQSVYKGKYKIRHFQTHNYTIDTLYSNSAIILKYPYGNISAGYHDVNVYRVNAVIPFTLGANDTILHSWVRNSSSSFFNHLAIMDPEVDIQIDSVTSSAAFVHGYYYYLNDAGAWLPTIEDTMWLAVTLHTVDTTSTEWSSNNELKADDGFLLYPNPCSSQLNVILKNSFNYNSSIFVMNLLGEIILQKEIKGETNKLTLNTNELESGVYLLVMRDNDKLTVKKFVVQH